MIKTDRKLCIKLLLYRDSFVILRYKKLDYRHVRRTRSRKSKRGRQASRKRSTTSAGNRGKRAKVARRERLRSNRGSRLRKKENTCTFVRKSRESAPPSVAITSATCAMNVALIALRQSVRPNTECHHLFYP